MKSIFADTSFFIALLVPNDQYHERAKELALRNKGPLLTTSAFVMELGGRFHYAGQHSIFHAILDILVKSKSRVVHVDAELQERAIALFSQRHDKDWSLTDCVSFVVMTDEGITEAATTDEHFEQAGFVALLRHPQAGGV